MKDSGLKLDLNNIAYHRSYGQVSKADIATIAHQGLALDFDLITIEVAKRLIKAMREDAGISLTSSNENERFLGALIYILKEELRKGLYEE